MLAMLGRSRASLTAAAAVFLILTGCLSPAGAEAQAGKPRPHRALTLDQRVDAILRRVHADRGSWGIEVAELPGGKILYRRNAGQLFVPASNMKLFTTAAALEKLGPDFVFRTTVESDAASDAQGRVADLYLVGRGDPNLGSRVLPYTPGSKPLAPADRVFEELAAQVKARGVREVTGNLVADDSYFLYEPFAANWAADDLQWGYGAPVTALAFNDNSLALHVKPGAKVGEPAQVWLDPVPDYYQLNNRLETSAASTAQRIFVERAPGSMELDVWGQVPLDASEDGDTVSIAHPPELIGEMFRRRLEAQGIVVRGRVVVRHLTRLEAVTSPDPFPASPRAVLAEHDSLPLREEIKVINKVSQNLHAEMLLRTLARETKKYGSLTVGLEALNEFVAGAGIARGETFFSDGSGLSREDLVTPQAIVRLLEFMSRSPRFPDYYHSLPIAGVDGTLEKRFTGMRVAGRIHAKTGSVEHVSALSGYMELPRGRRLAFSMIGNNHTLKESEGAAVLDAVALAVYDGFARRR